MLLLSVSLADEALAVNWKSGVRFVESIFKDTYLLRHLSYELIVVRHKNMHDIRHHLDYQLEALVVSVGADTSPMRELMACLASICGLTSHPDYFEELGDYSSPP